MTPDETEALKRHFAGDQFAATTGVELLELRPGFAKSRLVVEPRHLNGVGVVQGGAIFTLADFTFAVACNSAGNVALAVNTNLSFLKPTRSGTLWAEAVEVSRSRRISTCTVRVTNDENELVGLFQGTAYIKDERTLAVRSPLPPGEG